MSKLRQGVRITHENQTEDQQTRGCPRTAHQRPKRVGNHNYSEGNVKTTSSSRMMELLKTKMGPAEELGD